jgi:adenine-specific DNA-methyltransferase
MAKRKGPGKDGGAAGGGEIASDYRFPNKRKNNPPATLAAEGTVPAVPKAKYEYSPRLPPILRFDPNGKPDALPDLLAESTRRKLTADEAKTLANALRTQEPWLEWAGKREAKSFEVDPVALHIHERVSAQAILKVAARQDINHSLFADPEQEYREAVQFYRHNIPWTNRLILGDSLMVMSSLARREDLAGKVQMIYIDPPYGIKFASNFQPEIGNRDVKDKEQDLTREPEMVKAYRDTWQLGIHSYLSYLRDRLIIARELLADTGSLFVQISDDNVHRVRDLLSEVYGAENFMLTILLKKKGSQKSSTLDPINDFILWTTKDKREAAKKFRPLFKTIEPDNESLGTFRLVELPSGEELSLSDLAEREAGAAAEPLPLLQALTKFPGARLFSSENATAGGVRKNQSVIFKFRGQSFDPGIARGNCWKHTAIDDEGQPTGMQRLANANRLYVGGAQLRLKRYLSDFGASPVTNWWDDFGGAGDPLYVVQTNSKVIERCLLMTTDPGDLVLDPTCGGGTTAYAAEKWGRRWITMDTSRVAISIARQRLLCERFDYFRLRDDAKGVGEGFSYRTAPHVMSSTVANCAVLDPIFAKYKPILDERLKEANSELAKVPDRLRQALENSVSVREKKLGKKGVTEGERRRWILPAKGAGWQPWQIPFEVDGSWPKELGEAVSAYRTASLTQMKEVNDCIAANAKPEELVDQPEIVRGVVRVSGPFTVEAVQPPEMSLGDPVTAGTAENSLAFDGEPGEMQTFEMRPVEVGESSQNVEAYLSQMFRLLKTDGVRFPNNKQMRFTRLEPLYASGSASGFHAEGRWVGVGENDPDPDGPNNVCVVFGPQYGPVTAPMVEQLIKPASRRYDELVIAGFSFDGPAQATIEEAKNPRLRIHMAHIRPDVNPGMNGLLKEQPGSQFFTVFGEPITTIAGPDASAQYIVTMEGVVIYNPVDNSISKADAEKVAAWFLDGDYDGRTFCITQAFFPDKSAWEKLSKALNGPGGVIDAERFEALSGTKSLPFPAGKHKCAAVKVIDPRGNEVMRVHKL